MKLAKKAISKDMKEHCAYFADELAKYAEKFIREGHLGLKPGTYSARDVNNIIKKEIQRLDRDKRKYGYLLDNEDSLLKELFSFTDKIKHEHYYERPTIHILFKLIMFYERLAGLKGEKTHRWTISDNREICASFSALFPEKECMEFVLSEIKTDIKRYKGTSVILSLRDCCIRNLPLDYKPYSDDFWAVRVRPANYIPTDKHRHLCFKLAPDNLKHLNGKCQLYLYRGSEGSFKYTSNPYSYRLVIVNESGWSISTDEVVPALPEFLDLYDSSALNYCHITVPESVKGIHNPCVQDKSDNCDPNIERTTDSGYPAQMPAHEPKPLKDTSASDEDMIKQEKADSISGSETVYSDHYDTGLSPTASLHSVLSKNRGVTLPPYTNCDSIMCDQRWKNLLPPGKVKDDNSDSSIENSIDSANIVQKTERELEPL